MKKISVAICGILSAALLVSCSDKTTDIELENDDDNQIDVELTLWTFPVGNWGNPHGSSQHTDQLSQGISEHPYHRGIFKL